MLTLGGVNCHILQNEVLAFNRSSDTVCITVRDYGNMPCAAENRGENRAQLTADILAGNGPDILVLDDRIPFERYAAMGLFADMYPLLDADESLSRADFLPNVLAAGEQDSRLVRLIPSFGVRTMAVPAQRAQELAGWTLQSYCDYVEAHPELLQTTVGTFRRDMLDMAVQFNSGLFVDAAAGTCDFDNADFIRLLEHVAAFPETPDWGGYSDIAGILADGRGLMLPCMIYSDVDLRSTISQTGGPVRFVDFPTRDGSPGNMLCPLWQFALSENCSDKAAAWVFLSRLLSADYLRDEHSFPARADVLEEQLAQALLPQEDDGTDPNMALWTRALTQDEVDQLRELAQSAVLMVGFAPKMQDIINEEAAALYDGTRSAAEVARLIQERCSAYLAEQV